MNFQLVSFNCYLPFAQSAIIRESPELSTSIKWTNTRLHCYSICDSTYRKVPVVGKLEFELWGCTVKISQNMVQKWILRFHILWNLQYLIFKLLEGFGAKTVFSCKNWPLNCQNTNTFYRFPNFKSLFLKTNFSQICYDILSKIAISQERKVRFQNFLHQNWDKRTAI